MKDGDHSYLFYADSRMSEKRAQTMFIKEEGTIAWLKTMGDQDVLYDVGANIGLYTVFGAKRTKQVYAFEPHMANFYSLIRNVNVNRLNNVDVFSSAVHSESGIFNFYYDNFEIGGSNNQLEAKIYRDGREKTPVATEKKHAVSIDDLVYNLGLDIPTHVKIDVDGNEIKVLEGMAGVLKEGTIRSMIVEYNLDFGPKIQDFLKEYGYALKESQLTKRGKQIHATGVPVDKIAHNSLYEKI